MGEQKESGKRRFRKWVVILWILALGPVLGLAGTLFLISYDILFEPLPEFEKLENPKSNLASEIFSADQVILGTYFTENRSRIAFDQISPNVANALIATEDERYRSHSGIDLRGLARAISKGGTNGGASTITQQLAKMLFHEKPGTVPQRLIQKLKEWIIAARIERQYTKDEILAMYLNRFDFVNNAVGLKSAAKVYFSTTPDSLTLPQAAMLVGMAKNPSLFNPVRRADTTLHRRNVVFAQMLRNEMITREEFDSLKVLPLGLKYSKVDHKEGIAPYFREMLRMELKKIFSEKNENGEYKISKPDGEAYDIYRDGLRIYTTINSRMQRHAEWAVQEHLSKELQDDLWKDLKRKKNAPFDWRLSKQDIDRIMETARRRTSRHRILHGKECANCGRRGKYVEEKEIDGVPHFVCNAKDCEHQRKVTPKDSIPIIFNTPTKMKVFTWRGEKDTILSPNDSIRYYKSFLQSGLLSVDPHTGYIKAWVGGIDYKYFNYDHVRQGKRQVGSTFKPFVYAKAMDTDPRTYNPCASVPNVITCFDMPDGKPPYCPKNSDDDYGYNVTLKYGLANSMNTVTAYLMKRLGEETVIRYARKLGIESHLDPVPSLCLGVADLSLYEMVGAYSTFANKGRRLDPIFISRIEDKNGTIIYEPEQKSRDVMSEEVAYMMLNLLQGVTGYNYNEKEGRNIGGTGIRIRFERDDRPYSGIHTPIAGKTGTTQNNSDGWFMGITPDLLTGVWVGAEDRGVRFSTTAKGQGANTALPIWGYYMKKVFGDKRLDISKGDFEKPEGDLGIILDCNEVRKTRQNDGAWEKDPFD